MVTTGSEARNAHGIILGCDLTRVDLMNVQFSNVDLTNVNLTAACHLYERLD
jgi:uncharacterized protein YjbI with pentapeptide repeats